MSGAEQRRPGSALSSRRRLLFVPHLFRCEVRGRYSALSVDAGLAVLALQAGIEAAIKPANAITPATAAYVTTSVALIPKSNDAITRVAPSATTSPMPIPRRAV